MISLGIEEEVSSDDFAIIKKTKRRILHSIALKELLNKVSVDMGVSSKEEHYKLLLKTRLCRNQAYRYIRSSRNKNISGIIKLWTRRSSGAVSRWKVKDSNVCIKGTYRGGKTVCLALAVTWVRTKFHMNKTKRNFLK